MFVLASMVVIILLFTSDFSPSPITDISTLDPTIGRIQLVCSLVESRTTGKGFMLVFEDSRGQRIEGFAALEMAPMPPAQALVKVNAEVSWDDGPFLFVQEMTRVG